MMKQFSRNEEKRSDGKPLKSARVRSIAASRTIVLMIILTKFRSMPIIRVDVAFCRLTVNKDKGKGSNMHNWQIIWK